MIDASLSERVSLSEPRVANEISRSSCSSNVVLFGHQLDVDALP
jgi:hypothetical protein